MGTYIVGDVHGCFRTLEALLHRIAFEPSTDRLVFVGDLVNKGPDSLSVLRWVQRHRQTAETVLGNHELRLLRRHFGLAREKSSDTFDDVLTANDRADLITWILSRPLLIDAESFAVTHAGIPPIWDIPTARAWADHAARWLRQDPPAILERLRQISKEDGIPEGLPHIDDRRGATQALYVFTHSRYCHSDGTPCWNSKRYAEKDPRAVKPWFAGPHPAERRIFFGHWAALGVVELPHVVCLDGGCAYGGPLCAYCIDTGWLIRQPNLDFPDKYRRGSD